MMTYFGKETAGVGSRFVATIIDSIVLNVFFGSQRARSFMHGRWVEMGTRNGWVDFLYAAILIAIFSATIGKLIMNLQVVRTDGSKVTFWRALGREFAKILSGIPLGLGFLWALWDEKGQTWHDKIADTLVVKK